MRPDNRTRWVLFTHPGIGADGPWIGTANMDLVELGERVLLALHNENVSSFAEQAIRLRVRRVAA